VLGNLEAALANSRAQAQAVSSRAKRKRCWSRRPAPNPQGRARWTLELLAGELVSLTEHASVSHETVRRPWRKDMWCIPQVEPSMSPVWRMCSTSMLKSPIAGGAR
jgi:hypothetical protein